MSKPFDLLIFDWDGTLADSQARIVSSFHYAANKLQLPSRRDVDIRQMIGLSLNNAMYRLFPELDKVQCDELVLAYREHYFSDQALPSGLFPQALETIKQLATQGYQLSVATGKSRRGLDEGLEQTGLQAYFTVTRTAEETASKPDPQMLEEILWHTGVVAERALMVGDTTYDLLMANRAHMSSLAVSYGMHSKEQLMECQPLGCIDTIAEMVDWLTGLGQR